MDQEQNEMVVYWQPNCVFCLDLLLRLASTRLHRKTFDIRKDPPGETVHPSVADGSQTVPTIVVAGQALVNLSKLQRVEAVRAHAPHVLGTSRWTAPGLAAAPVREIFL